MTVRELSAAFDKIYPRELSAEWDRDGLMVSPDPEREVYRVLCVLDVTDAVIEGAIENRFDTIVSHHPLIFRPLSSVVAGDGVGGKVAKLLANGISVLSFHTRADAAPGGVNDLLACSLGLGEIAPFADGLPRVGRYPAPLSSAEFLRRVASVTGASELRFGGHAREVATVALCGGAGKEYVGEAALIGVDAYLSGELGYHTLLDAEMGGPMLLEIGHDASEVQIVGAFAGTVRRLIPGAKVSEWTAFSLGRANLS